MDQNPSLLSDSATEQSPTAPAALTLEQARDRAQRYPDDPRAWLELAQLSINTAPDQAHEAAQKLGQLLPNDYDVRVILGKLSSMAGQYPEALEHYERALEIKPDDFEMLCQVASLQLQTKGNEQTLVLIERALAQQPDNVHALYLKAYGLIQAHRYDDAARVLQHQLIPLDSSNAYYWNLLGQIYRDTGALTQAQAAYIKSAELADAGKNQAAYVDALSNRLTLMHYMPEHSAEDILQACKEWGALFSPGSAITRPRPTNRNPARKIRVGMYADGFSAGPVSLMITPALEHLRRYGFEIYLYANNPAYDVVAQRLIAATDKHAIVAQLSNEQFSQRIRDDEIDIMVDLAGYNTSTRMSAMVQEPAPLLIKWVGGLINTTGLPAFDYLITDRVESPLGSDAFYTEKLIRMPDDYICYLPPPSMPDVGRLPAQNNGYITLGCFNNPTKINEVVLEKWAGIMRVLPASRLFLKGGAYESTELRQRVLDLMGKHGIAAERLRLEGQSKHYELLACYNDVDIALDPWPYSGGLTTCEALLMGVPVVTRPGPTFAGRHSASHVANAGIPELVAEDWDQYQACVLALATDLENLAALRGTLRKTLLDSPVCDSARYAKHLATGLRAIWQRYCEDKPRASLVFTPDGKPWFEDSSVPMDVVEPAQTVKPSSEAKDFQFQLRGKIVTLDHGGSFVGTKVSRNLSNLGSLVTIAIDPAHVLQSQQQDMWGRLIQHHYHHVALGNGAPTTLYLCQESNFSGTLAPLAIRSLAPALQQRAHVLTTQTIPTVRLDDLTGLEKLDWMILNAAHDNSAILRGAQRLLAQALIVQVQTTLVDVFENSSQVSGLAELLAKHGFTLAGRLLPDSNATPLGEMQVFEDTVFIPNTKRLQALSDDQCWKLAFLLHSAYNLPNLAFRVLKIHNPTAALEYLKGNDLPEPVMTPAEIAAERRPPFGKLRSTSEKKRFIHLGYNNIHTQALVKLLAHPMLTRDFEHHLFINDVRSIRDFDIDLSDNAHAWFFHENEDMEALLQECLCDDVTAVIFHSMFFDWQKSLVRNIGEKQRTIWAIWGSDLYNPIKDGQPLTDVVAHIDAVCTVSDGDYKIFLEHYPARPQFTFGYTQNNPYANIINPEKKQKKIIVGNSGDISNDHLDILEILAQKVDIADYDIVLPLAYNLLDDYEPYIHRQVKALGLEDRVTYLKKFLPVADYYALIAQSELLVTAHQRQQALGALTAASYFGVKTVLRETIDIDGKLTENPAWTQICSLGAAPISFEQFASVKRLQDLPAVPQTVLGRVQALLAAGHDIEKYCSIFRDTFHAMDTLTPVVPAPLATKLSINALRIVDEIQAKQRMLQATRSHIRTLAIGSHVSGWNFDPRFCTEAFNLCFGMQDLKYAALLYRRHIDMPELRRVLVFCHPTMWSNSLEDTFDGGQFIAQMASDIFHLDSYHNRLAPEQNEIYLKAAKKLELDKSAENGFLPHFLPAYFEGLQRPPLEPFVHAYKNAQIDLNQQKALDDLVDAASKIGHQVIFVLPAVRSDYREALGSSRQVFSRIWEIINKKNHTQIIDLYSDESFKDEFFRNPIMLDPTSPGTELLSRRIATLVSAEV